METAFAHSLLMEGAAAAAISQLDSVARQQVTWRSLATTLLQEPANPLNLSLPPSPHTSLFFPPPSAPLYSSSALPLLLMLPDLSFFFHGALLLLITAPLPPLASDKCLLICATGHLHKHSFEGAAFRCIAVYQTNFIMITTHCRQENVSHQKGPASLCIVKRINLQSSACL